MTCGNPSSSSSSFLPFFAAGRKKIIEKQVEMRGAKEGERWMRDVNHAELKWIRVDYGADERRVRLLP